MCTLQPTLVSGGNYIKEGVDSAKSTCLFFSPGEDECGALARCLELFKVRTYTKYSITGVVESITLLWCQSEPLCGVLASIQRHSLVFKALSHSGPIYLQVFGPLFPHKAFQWPSQVKIIHFKNAIGVDKRKVLFLVYYFICLLLILKQVQRAKVLKPLFYLIQKIHQFQKEFQDFGREL